MNFLKNVQRLLWIYSWFNAIQVQNTFRPAKFLIYGLIYTMFSAGSYTARPAAAAYVTYPAVQTYSYAPVVSAPGAATGYAAAFQQTAAVPRHVNCSNL